MNSTDIGQKLISMGKKGFAANHQDNEFLKTAGRMMLAMEARLDAYQTSDADKEERINALEVQIATLEEEKTILEERIAIMLGDEEPETESADDGEYDWDDMWPLNPKG